MDRQDMIASSIAAVVRVAAGALPFRPDGTERATVATGQPADQPAAGTNTTSTESSDQ